MVRLYRTSAHLKDKAVDSALSEKMRSGSTVQIRAAYRSPMAFLTAGEIELMGGPKVKGTGSGARITAWTRRSRSRMQDKLARLDFMPLFEDGLEPAMVTLTMPGQWEHLTPDPATFKKMVDRFTLYYQRAWGQRPRGVWKMEFQQRGAPHLHILMTPPAGTVHTRRGELEFGEWLQYAWPAVVGATGEERAKHERAHGSKYTIEYVGDAYRDPRRIGTYFGKHGFFSAKDYQNEIPELWATAIDNGATSARFWGSWGLQDASVSIQLDETGSATIETILDPLGVVRGAAKVISRIISESELEAESATGATDATVMRAMQRCRDDLGSQASDAVKVQRHLRKLSRSQAMRGANLVRNKHGQLVLARECHCEYSTSAEGRRYRSFYCSAHVVRRVSFDKTDRDTGEVTRARRYSVGWYQGGSGRVYVNDGRTAARDLLRILSTQSDWIAAA